MPIKRMGIHRKKRAYRCDWCREVCGREGCEDRVQALRRWESATAPVERAREAREDYYLFTETEAHEILSLAAVETPWARVPAQREPQPYPMESVSA
jgi:hypothetical protein